MHTVVVTTDLPAPPSACFDAARDLRVHVASAAATRERVVSTTSPSGLLELHDDVTFEAVHLGVKQRLSAKIVAFERPHHFRDRMTRGAFRSLEHDHRFAPLPCGGTRMTDELRFEVPLGALGRLLGHHVIAPHLRRFLLARAEHLRAHLENA